MKQLKDYLYLYPQSNISVFIFSDESITDGFLDTYRKNYPEGVYNPILTFENYERYLKDGYKPILRKLSDMTEEEARECWSIVEKTYPGRGWISNPKCALTDYTFKADWSIHQWSIAFPWLLSKGFDLFGLIDAKLAIDKKTL